MANKRKPKRISLIIAVYNNFKWLKLILDSTTFQSFRDFEIIIADDGSNPETVKKIQDYIALHPAYKIFHSRHEDKGWRKNEALNKAVRASIGEYLVFIDGDCILHPRFLEDHYRLRRHGVVTGGRRVETSQKVTEMIESWEKLPENYFGEVRKAALEDIRTDFSKSLAQLKRTLRFPYIFGKPIGVTDNGNLGANFGIYRSDLEKVNGFDERYVNPGTGEDCDLDLRLANAGIKHVKVSHYALMLHRCHERLFWGAPENAVLYENARKEKLTYVPTGMYKPDNNKELNSQK